MKNRQPFIDIFLEKNKQINLSAIRDPEGVFAKHIQDSLEVNTILTFPKGVQVADIGTGGGFPLMPLAITNPQVHFTGIDSIKKKTVAVNDMLQSLHITNAKVICSRIEELKGQSFDIITARAVAHVEKLIPRSYHLLKKGGKLILMKQALKEEKTELDQLCKKFHLQLENQHHYSLFEGDIERVIYVIEKLKKD